MPVKADDQGEQNLHLKQGCASSQVQARNGRYRRDDSIADNVGTTRSQSGGLAEAR